MTFDLWAATESGGVTQCHKGVFTAYTTQHGLPGDEINGVTGDEGGSICVLSQGRIMRWEIGRFRSEALTAAKA
jgi:hypothetical protein